MTTISGGDDARRRVWRRFLLLFIVSLLPFLGLETAAYCLYREPALLPGSIANPLTMAFRLLYRRHMSIIQWEPDCSYFNDTVHNFTLRPGRCVHSNAEFSVEVAANRMGLRATDADLDAPEIIVLGASEAMGWGVRAEETASARLQQASGLKVLNAAVSGYGFHQSLALLGRLDRSHLRYLVIFYFIPGDVNNVHAALVQKEPVADYRNSRELYDSTVAGYLANKRAVAFGGYLSGLIASWYSGASTARAQLLSFGPNLADPSYVDAAGREFVEILDRAPELLGDATVVVVPFIPRCLPYGDGLARAIDRYAASGQRRSSNRILTVKPDSWITPQHCFVLDPHINASGHAAMAQVVAELIRADAGGRQGLNVPGAVR